MSYIYLEYVWLDGYSTQNLRSKIKIMNARDLKWKLDEHKTSRIPEINSIPIWNFDGSSTMQAPGEKSELILKPVRIYNYSEEHTTFIILCEVYSDDITPHSTNTRCQLRKNLPKKDTYWWGFEQEYFITNPKTNKPAGFPPDGYPNPQGKYYCGVGTNQVSMRHLTKHHTEVCLGSGITLTGTNAEVALGQWEYQCFATNTLKGCDDLWISRYILHRVSEDYQVDINMDPKPIQGDWNGSGCHTNFSNIQMRNTGGRNYFLNIIEKLDTNHTEHILCYGKDNNLRLTGEHETQHILKFSYGVGDRGASIRIPASVEANNWKGYLEDRRPASNCDPYKVTNCIITALNVEQNNTFEETNG